MDVQRATVSAAEPQPEPAQAGATAIDPALAADIEQVLASLHGARRPLLLVAGGLRCARAADIFRKLVSQLGVPGAAMRLVGVMRQFEMLQKAVSLGVEMDSKSIQEVARVGS